MSAQGSKIAVPHYNSPQTTFTLQEFLWHALGGGHLASATCASAFPLTTCSRGTHPRSSQRKWSFRFTAASLVEDKPHVACLVQRCPLYASDQLWDIRFADASSSLQMPFAPRLGCVMSYMYHLGEFVKNSRHPGHSACSGGTELQSVDRIQWIVWIVWIWGWRS